MPHIPLKDFDSAKSFWFLKKTWLKRVLIPAHEQSIPLPEASHFTTNRTADGVHIRPRLMPSNAQGIGRFAVRLTIEDGVFSGEGTINAGSLIVPGQSADTGHAAPLVHEPWVWPVDHFPFSLTGIELESAVALKLTWKAARELPVDNLTGIDDPEHERHLMTWGLDEVDIVTISAADFAVLGDSPEPEYDWDWATAATAITYAELARITEDPENAGLPLLTQKITHDFVVAMPLTHDLLTKPSVAYPPGSPEGPTDLRPVVFYGPTQGRQVECIKTLGANNVGYCRQLIETAATLTIDNYTMATITGQTSKYSRLHYSEGATTNVATLESPDDPLA